MAHVSAEDRIASIRQTLLWDHPFFLIVSMALRWEEATDASNPTMRTNGRYLQWNREFVEKHPHDELLFAVLHELFHVILGHHYRRRGRDIQKWQWATDFAINQELIDLKVGKFNPDWLYFPAFRGMTAEEIYTNMPDIPPGNGKGQIGDVVDCGESDAEIAEAELDNHILIQQAVDAASKKPGSIPGSIRKMIDELLEPKVDWRSKLQELMHGGNRQDSSWSRPNTRRLALGHYFPGMVKDGINHIVYVRDTSGSLFGMEEQRQIASEAADAFYNKIVDKITIIDCDAGVQNVTTFEQGDQLDFDCKGGGGTDFAPAMRYIAENIPDAQAVIYFTDMYCSSFGPEPPCKMIWAIIGTQEEFRRLRSVPPFGESLHIEA